MTRLKIFHGTLEEAKQVALLDNDQYVIKKFVAYRGDPLVRTTMEFEILFEDGSIVWLPYSKDIFDSVPYEEFCRMRPELLPLLHDAKTAAALMSRLNRTPITEVKPGDVVYVDLRSYGAGWYESLNLPDKDHSSYMLRYEVSVSGRINGRPKLNAFVQSSTRPLRSTISSSKGMAPTSTCHPKKRTTLTRESW